MLLRPTYHQVSSAENLRDPEEGLRVHGCPSREMEAFKNLSVSHVNSKKQSEDRNQHPKAMLGYDTKHKMHLVKMEIAA